MVTTYRKDVDPVRAKYAEDFRNGLTFSELGRKYGEKSVEIADVIYQFCGFIEFEHKTGKLMKSQIRRLYETEFLTIAQGIVDKCGLMELCDRVGTSRYVLRRMLRDLVNEENYDRIIRRKYRHSYTDEFKNEIKRVYREGMTLMQIRSKYRICYPTINKIINDKL